MTDAVAAKGTKLQWDNNGTWETIGEITSGPGGPSESVESSDATNHQSTNDAMEHVPVLIDGGEVTISVNYTGTKNQHEKIRTKKENLTIDSWRILHPDGSTYALEFNANIGSLEPSFDPDSTIDADITLDITGDVVQNNSP